MTTPLPRGDDTVTIPTRTVVTLYPSIWQGVTSRVTRVTTPMGYFLFLSAMDGMNPCPPSRHSFHFLVDVHTPKANVQYTTLDRKPLKSVRNRHQTNTILNTSHEPKSTTVLELKYRSYEMFTIIQEFTEKYRGFRGSLFSIHPLSGCERLHFFNDLTGS